MKLKIDLSGFRELERALAEDLPKATAKAALRRTAVNSMNRIENGMKNHAPRDRGDLIASIKTKPAKPQRIPGTKRYARSGGVSVNTGPSGRPEGGNPAWQENGTVDMPAHPYARPTADAEGENVITEVKGELTKQIDAAKARIAKKAARAGR
ncbi:hypothetical protein [uncultured Novosphingobium sp.]|uniref:hypothetical protein n=1 Tax=uncultured Novosphingobium sp. TaxID=292277 RepID=UPI00374A8698